MSCPMFNCIYEPIGNDMFRCSKCGDEKHYNDFNRSWK